MKFYTILHNGLVYIVDKKGSIHQTLALRNGDVPAAETAGTVLPPAGDGTEHFDPRSVLVAPGRIANHLRLFRGTKPLAHFSLSHAPLSVEEILSRIQDQLDQEGLEKSDDWLQVCGWLRVDGSDVTRHDLAHLNTRRPVVLFSNDCHSAALNNRALELLNINECTPEPDDGAILRDDSGVPTGIIEDAPAMRICDSVTRLHGDAAVAVLDISRKILNRQG